MRTERFLHWVLLMIWFVTRYFVECMLMLLDPVAIVRLPFEWDSFVLQTTDILVGAVRSWGVVARSFWKLLRSNRWLAVPFGLLFEYFIMPDHRSIVVKWGKWVGGVYGCVGVVAHTIKKEDSLWQLMGTFLAFTRSQVGTTHACRVKVSDTWSILQPLAIQRFVILAFTIYIVCQRKSRQDLLSYKSNFTLDNLPNKSGYTARIISCYDGDTCYLESLAFDGNELPPLFQKMKLRLRGIDAPERRQAHCLFEKCLADLSRDALQDILFADSNASFTLLEDCSHDKYGGRILCDVHTANGDAAALMVKSGLAVPYHGRTKTSPWCTQSFQQNYLNRQSQNHDASDRLRKCLSERTMPQK